MSESQNPPVIDYEGSDYQTSFWEEGGRAYEDQVEAAALAKLLPASGEMLLELGAGAGRNTPRYAGYRRVVLLDYSLTQLQQAQARLGQNDRYTYVAANIYHLPFREGIFDAATMIRVLHHMADAPLALRQIRRVLHTGSAFILEFANKQNIKAILRYWFRRQDWNPFSREAVEFAALNFDFHPAAVREWLDQAGFEVQRQLTVSHFRIGLLKRLLPTSLLVSLDSAIQFTGQWWQLTPSVFVASQAIGDTPRPEKALALEPAALFCCPACGRDLLFEEADTLSCSSCNRSWPVVNGIFDFREA
jgi:ubiquinone/menaquinone biosynthesis C-methylase UbiE